MNLSRTRSDRRDRLLCRCGVMLVICSLLVNMVWVPKAKAVAVVDDVAVGAAATAAYLTSTGIPLTVTAGGASAASAGIVAVAGEYAAATGAAASGEAVLSSIAAGTALTAAGTVVLTAAAAVAVGAFAYWVYETYLQDSSLDSFNPLYSSDGVSSTYSEYLIDGTPLYVGTIYSIGVTYVLPSGSTFCISHDADGHIVIALNGNVVKTTKNNYSYVNYYYLDPVGNAVYCDSDRHTLGIGDNLSNYNRDMWYIPNELLGFNNNYSPIPEIAPAKQLELDIAAPPELELADLPEFTMNKVAAGDWSQPSNVPYSVTSVDPDPVPEPSDPGGNDPSLPEDTPDIEDLGLPELGAALITRFPFSIPWDIARAIKLIAAPAEAPYWEVDFLSAIGHRFPGGLGDTKIVLDFGEPEFEIIGIASRWTSTIGFCLALAAATKRFIWTA